MKIVPLLLGSVLAADLVCFEDQVSQADLEVNSEIVSRFPYDIRDIPGWIAAEQGLRNDQRQQFIDLVNKLEDLDQWTTCFSKEDRQFYVNVRNLNRVELDNVPAPNIIDKIPLESIVDLKKVSKSETAFVESEESLEFDVLYQKLDHLRPEYVKHQTKRNQRVLHRLKKAANVRAKTEFAQEADRVTKAGTGHTHEDEKKTETVENQAEDNDKKNSSMQLACSLILVAGAALV